MNQGARDENERIFQRKLLDLLTEIHKELTSIDGRLYVLEEHSRITMATTPTRVSSEGPWGP